MVSDSEVYERASAVGEVMGVGPRLATALANELLNGSQWELLDVLGVAITPESIVAWMNHKGLPADLLNSPDTVRAVAIDYFMEKTQGVAGGIK